MYCHEVNENIYALCDGTLSPTLKAKIAQHLDECEKCREYYSLVAAETEALRDTSDIPELAPNFTAMIMNSLDNAPADSAPNESGPLTEKRAGSLLTRPWYLTLAAAAAAIVLFLYVPQLFNAGSDVNIAKIETSSSQNAPAPDVADKAEPDGSSEIHSMPAVTSPQLSTPVVKKPTVKTEAPVSSGSQQTATQPDQPVATLNRTADTTAVIKTAAPVDANESFSKNDFPSLSPHNLPDRFQLVETDIFNSREIVFNYSSPNEQETLQISVVPDESVSAESGPFTRSLVVGDQKFLVKYSGNLSAMELEQLADTVTIEATASLESN